MGVPGSRHLYTVHARANGGRDPLGARHLPACWPLLPGLVGLYLVTVTARNGELIVGVGPALDILDFDDLGFG
jgi:hypothetical protein